MAHPTLRQGMKGNKGTDLGTAIYNWRVFMGLKPAGNVTVYDFGKATFDKTKAWQKKVGFTGKDIDGVVGPKSWAKYDAAQAVYTGPMAAVAPAIAAAAAAATPYVSYTPPGAQQAAEVIAATAPVIPQAVATAAQTIAAAAQGKAPKQPKAPKVAQPAAPPKTGVAAVVATVKESPFFQLPGSFQEAKDQVVKTVEATPLWLRIVTGTGTALLTFMGIRKLTKHH